MQRSRGYAPFFTSPENTALLHRIHAHAQAGGVAVFDLDGCLFDNRPRQIHIFREYASQRGALELYRVGVDHLVDWSLQDTLRRAGLSEAFIGRHASDLRKFWEERFFSSDYMFYDHAMPGAVDLVRRVQDAGMTIVYLTGRDTTLRPGSEGALKRFGFPSSNLLVKPNAAQDDTTFKEQAMEILSQLGPVRLYVDNEPANVNVYHRRHPEALVVFVETDHSPKPITPHPDIPWLRSFCLA